MSFASSARLAARIESTSVGRCPHRSKSRLQLLRTCQHDGRRRRAEAPTAPEFRTFAYSAASGVESARKERACSVPTPALAAMAQTEAVARRQPARKPAPLGSTVAMGTENRTSIAPACAEPPWNEDPTTRSRGSSPPAPSTVSRDAFPSSGAIARQHRVANPRHAAGPRHCLGNRWSDLKQPATPGKESPGTAAQSCDCRMRSRNPIAFSAVANSADERPRLPRLRKQLEARARDHPSVP